MRTSEVPWMFIPCTPEQFVDLVVNDAQFYVSYHTSRGDVDVRIGEWNEIDGERVRITTFKAPIHAPKRVLQIIGKEHTVITEWQYVDCKPGATPELRSTYKPDVMGSYFSTTAVFRTRYAPGGCEVAAEIRVSFNMAIVGHLFEAFIIRSAEDSARQQLQATLKYVRAGGMRAQPAPGADGHAATAAPGALTRDAAAASADGGSCAAGAAVTVLAAAAAEPCAAGMPVPSAPAPAPASPPTAGPCCAADSATPVSSEPPPTLFPAPTPPWSALTVPPLTTLPAPAAARAAAVSPELVAAVDRLQQHALGLQRRADAVLESAARVPAWPARDDAWRWWRWWWRVAAVAVPLLLLWRQWRMRRRH